MQILLNAQLSRFSAVTPIFTFIAFIFKNSRKQRKTASGFAVISVAAAAAAQDFRQEPKVARCYFREKQRKTARSAAVQCFRATRFIGATKKPGRICLSGF